jgi:hypothetical protein
MQALLDIVNNNQPPRRWRYRLSDTQKLAHLKKVIKIIRWASGNDLGRMLIDLFKYKSIYFATFTRESKALKKILRKLNNRIKPKNKHYFLRSLRLSGFSREECIELGFKHSTHLWESCYDRQKRLLGGRPKMSQRLKDYLEIFLRENSQPSSYRVATKITKRPFEIKKNEVRSRPFPSSIRRKENCRFFNNTISELQKNFPGNRYRIRRYRNRNIRTLYPSKVFFFKYIASLKTFKRARNRTDLCDYCEISFKITKRVNEFIRLNHLNHFQEDFNLNKYLNDFGVNQFQQNNMRYPEGEDESDNEVVDANQNDARFNYEQPVNNQNICQFLKLLKQVEHHQFVSQRIRRAYLSNTTDPRFYSNSILLEFDYKQVT